MCWLLLGFLDQVCGSDGSNAMHCVAAGGSTRAVEVVQLLLSVGANTNVRDIEGRRPADVLTVSLNRGDVKGTLEGLLSRGELPSASMLSSFEMLG